MNNLSEDIKNLALEKDNPDQFWSVYTYVLVNSNDENDKGILYLYGTYNNYKKASKISEKLALKYESLYFMVRKTRSWQLITEKVHPNNMKYIDNTSKADKLIDKKEEELKRMYEKEMALRNKLEEDRVKALDETTIEHYIRQYTFAVNKIEYINHLKENLNKEIGKVIETREYIEKLNEKNPEYENIWLDVFKEKMIDIENTQYYDIVDKLYKKINTIKKI